jgi:phage terminase large subunit-like protein
MIPSSLLLKDTELAQLTPLEAEAYYQAMMELSNVEDAETFLLGIPHDNRKGRLHEFSEEIREALKFKWRLWVRPKQVLPEDCECHRGNWATWLILSGRGYGKTRVGAETVRRWAKDFKYVNLIGPTADDLRDSMIQGESGILAICPPNERPYYAKSDRQLKWPNGAISLLFSAEEPERLRNKQSEKIWMDEVAGYRYPTETFDMAMFGLRLGKNPQTVITTTPKPIKLIKDLLADPTTHVTRGTTYENKRNLAPKFFSQIVEKYKNTRLGRQELNAEVLEDNPGALWKIQTFEDTRVKEPPKNIRRIVVSVDPAVTSNDESDEWGLGVCAEDDQSPPHYYVFEDASGVFTPDQAADKAIFLYNKYGADLIVAEVNQGGDMVEALLRNKQHAFAYRAVHATKGKYLRAEPIAALYEQGRAHHVGYFALLESQCCDYVPGITKKSPDRLDFLVWGLTELSGSGLFGGWLMDGAKKAAEEKDAPVEPATIENLAVAQKTEAAKGQITAGVFGADKNGWVDSKGHHHGGSMAGSKVLTSKLMKPQTNDKTPACPNCGNKNLSAAGAFRSCSCGWNNRQPVNELGVRVQGMQKVS